MGSLKDMMFENEENINFENLAYQLGVSVDELEQLDFEIIENRGKDGVIYGNRIEFNLENSPREILKKIRGLGGSTFLDI